MLEIYQEEIITVPESVKLTFKARAVTVVGPRGTLSKTFRHINMEIQRCGKNKIKVIVWHGGRKHSACLGTVTSHINNLIIGVTKHFPINVNITDNGTVAEIRNFLGEKYTRKIKMLEGVTIEVSKDVKDEIILFGNNVDNVSQSAASIQQSTLARNKDIRKFLDGVYVSQKTNIVLDD